MSRSGSPGRSLRSWQCSLGQRVRPRLPALVATALFVGCLIAQLAIYYHIAALLGLAGSIVAFRYRGTAPIERRYWRFILGSAVDCVGARGTDHRLAGIDDQAGRRDRRPAERLAVRARHAVLDRRRRARRARSAWGLWGLAFNKRVTDYWLLALLGVWIPVFCIGFFVWDLPVALYGGIAHPGTAVRLRICAALHRRLVGPSTGWQRSRSSTQPCSQSSSSPRIRLRRSRG